MDPLSRLNIRLAYQHGIIEYPELCKLLSEQAFCVRLADILEDAEVSASPLQSEASEDA
jgi:hypothetical protein